MKSKRAEEYIGESIYDAGDLVDKDGCGWAVVKRSDAYRAVELAEEDMVEKAEAAFCSERCFAGCPLTSKDYCSGLQRFKQKLISE